MFRPGQRDQEPQPTNTRLWCVLLTRFNTDLSKSGVKAFIVQEVSERLATRSVLGHYRRLGYDLQPLINSRRLRIDARPVVIDRMGLFEVDDRVDNLF